MRELRGESAREIQAGEGKKKKKRAVLEGCGVAPALRELAKVKPSKKMTCA